MAMTRPRAEAMADFLRSLGRDPAAARPLAGDASNRRYLRLADDTPAVLMDAPPERGEDVRPFLAMTGTLRARGLSAPEVFGADIAQGFVLMEDLGDGLFARVCEARPAAEPALYAAAVDLLAEALGDPPYRLAGPHGEWPLAPYDADALLREARLAVEWYLAGQDPAQGSAPGADPGADPVADPVAEAFDAALSEALAPVAEERSALVLRDFHAENLLWLPGRGGLARVGLLDYQDALAGHPAYDLVSLLEDARRDTSPDLRAAMVARFLERRPDLDPEAFRHACAVLGAQRNLKIVGIFARLCLRDGKRRYPTLIPRVWGHLMRDLEHPALAPLRAWVAAHLPPPEPAVLARLGAEG